MEVEIQSTWFSVEECLANPKKLYVFGDNLIGVGKGGQAQIRDCDNAIGVSTKRLPSMDDKSFFNDESKDFYGMVCDLNLLLCASKTSYDTLVFPIDGLGTGLSQMPERSPKVFKILCDILNLDYGVTMTEKGFINE